MLDDLTEDWREFSRWGWDRISPFADELLQRELTADTLADWLSDWSRLASLIAETFTRFRIRTTTHTNDEDGRTRFRRYSENIMPNARAFEQNMKLRLLASGLEPPDFAIPLRKMRSDAAIYREENLALQMESERLEVELQAITGGMTVDWDGEPLTLTQAMTKLGEPDRGTRQRAWRGLTECLLRDRQAIDRIWVQLLDLRLRMARNAGFDDYRAFRWKELGRFDYTPDDCKAFHAAIQDVVVPATARMSERRKAQLSVDKLRVWDDFWFVRPDALGRPALKPFQTVDELTSALQRIFLRMDPSLGAHFQTLTEEDLLDLDSRQHKAQGGYMEELPASKRAFVFANVAGAHRDVVTLLHESGHAFHLFEAVHWPYHLQFMLQHMPIEFIEVASMAMELLAAPYLTRDQGGLYTQDEAHRAQTEHLEVILGFWPYMAVVDAFQHWVYENPESARDPRKCDDAWAGIHRQYLPWLDWSGVEDTLRLAWRLQEHILLSPFYYVEYGMAQLGAIQVWANSLEDHAAAVQAYRTALSLGGTASLPDLYQAAGGKFRFDRETLSQAVNLVEGTIHELSGYD